MDTSFNPKLWEYIRVKDIIQANQMEGLPYHLRGQPERVVAMILYADPDIFGPGNYLERCPEEPKVVFKEPPQPGPSTIRKRPAETLTVVQSEKKPRTVVVQTYRH